MIAVLALIAGFPGHFSEIPAPNAPDCEVEVIAPLPKDFDAKDRGTALALARTVLVSLDNYTPGQIRGLTAGRPCECVVMPDCLRIHIETPGQDWRIGLSIAHAAIQDSLFPDDDVKSAIESLPFFKPSYWRYALSSEATSFQGLSKPKLLKFYRQVFRPDHLFVSVRGPFLEGQAFQKWNSYYPDEWKAPIGERLRPAPEERYASNTGPVTVSELRGPSFSGTAPGLTAKILALYALGAGKDSSVFRIVREKLRLSYRQEALLWPTLEGFEMRIVSVFRPREDEGELPDRVRGELYADCDHWTEATRLHALSMAEASLTRQFVLSPLPFFAPEQPAFTAAYWKFKTGHEFDQAGFLDALRQVPLESMISEAKSFLSGARPITLPGR